MRVLEHGAIKYSEDQWRVGGDKMSKLDILDSLQRHVGKLIDAVREEKSEIDESGVHHIGPIFANAMFYSYHHVIGKQETEEGE